MSDLPQRLPELLKHLTTPGQFFSTGFVDLPVGLLGVRGERLGLPLTSREAARLHASGEDAPYGLGPKTVVDHRVRRCREYTTDHLELGPRWWRLVDALCQKAAEGLGIDGPLRAELYKLLVYGPGDHFAEHRDAHKAPGMVGTLVLSLPSSHQGALLRVRHADKQVALPLRSEDPGVAGHLATTMWPS
jgi:hypothetical protein